MLVAWCGRVAHVRLVDRLLYQTDCEAAGARANAQAGSFGYSFLCAVDARHVTLTQVTLYVQQPVCVMNSPPPPESRACSHG